MVSTPDNGLTCECGHHVIDHMTIRLHGFEVSKPITPCREFKSAEVGRLREHMVRQEAVVLDYAQGASRARMELQEIHFANIKLEAENAALKSTNGLFRAWLDEMRAHGDPDKINLAKRLPCGLCGNPVGIEFSIPNEIWNAVIRPDGDEQDHEYLCYPCWLKAVGERVAALKAENAKQAKEIVRLTEKKATHKEMLRIKSEAIEELRSERDAARTKLAARDGLVDRTLIALKEVHDMEIGCEECPSCNEDEPKIPCPLMADLAAVRADR